MSAPDRPDYGEFAYGTGFYGGPGIYEALIESPNGSSAPRLVTDYEAAREARTQVLDAVDGGEIIVLMPARRRAGMLRLLYLTAEAARHAVDLHADPVLFTLTHPEVPTLNMTYAAVGRARMTPDPSRLVWHVDVEYREVAP